MYVCVYSSWIYGMGYEILLLDVHVYKLYILYVIDINLILGN